MRKFVEHGTAIAVAGVLAGAYSELMTPKQVMGLTLAFAIYVVIIIAWKS